jgi:hypothetical protein
MKVLNWIIALFGLWEFGDIAALFVPGFGNIPVYVWNHIIIGFLLMIVGVWVARSSNVVIARTMNWIAAGAGLWLVISSYILRHPVLDAGFWNDVIVGVIVLILGVWAALRSSRVAG